MVKIKPILFNTEMVLATLENRKTATRRVVKPQPLLPYFHEVDGEWFWTSNNTDDDMMAWWPSYETGLRPPYRPSDILYVRETWAESADGYVYRADDPDSDGWGWRPSIHMPREAARIFLRVTGVRVERLQEIDDAQAYAEGAEGVPCNCDGSEVFCSRCCNTGWFISPRSEFTYIWDSTIKPVDRALCGWRANPWVWVIEFQRCEKPEEREVIPNAWKENAPALFPVPLCGAEGVLMLRRLRAEGSLSGGLPE